MAMLLENKHAVIYGAGGAIGAAVARTFAREGARVFLVGRTLAPLEALTQEITQAGDVAEAALVDALDEESVERHLSEVVRSAGRVDISFNAISISYIQGDPLTELSVEQFTRPIADAMKTQFLTTRAAARQMRRQGAGVILALTASPARLAVANSGNFGVACAAIEGLCRQLAADHGPSGVRVVCLRSAGSPDGAVVSEVMRQLAEQEGITREAFEARIAERTLLKRMPRLAEVANVAALMASDRAGAITGMVANVTCGEIVD
jgi:NAD(P)-dependent dehydrogenase (short-subunit alcohol dehydrogenase family)